MQGLYSNYLCDKMALSKLRSQTLLGSQTQIEPQSRSRAFSDRGKSYSYSHCRFKSLLDCYQLNIRAFHCTVSVADSLYVWAGHQVGLPLVHDNEKKRRLTRSIDHFTLSTGHWISKATTGTPPLGVRGYSCTAIDDQLYYFGGYCGHKGCFHNSISQLNTANLHWTELEPTDPARPVMRRCHGGMISFKNNGEQHLLIIGGQGSKPAMQLPHTINVEDDGNKWRTNEHSIYNLSSSELYMCGYAFATFILCHHNKVITYWLIQ